MLRDLSFHLMTFVSLAAIRGASQTEFINAVKLNHFKVSHTSGIRTAEGG
jgi:hypothetical protein